MKEKKTISDKEITEEARKMINFFKKMGLGVEAIHEMTYESTIEGWTEYRDMLAAIVFEGKEEKDFPNYEEKSELENDMIDTWFSIDVSKMEKKDIFEVIDKILSSDEEKEMLMEKIKGSLTEEDFARSLRPKRKK